MQLWVTEKENQQIRVSYSTTKVLFREQSEFQLVEVVETDAYGRMLLIDGLVMLTDVDEFVYHEMISHVPALLHPNPKNVIVIGGGDGGTVRELLKHPEIEKITLCEIDEVVINASKEFFPQVACGFYDKKVETIVGDGVAYVKELPENSVDIFIVDSTDPISVGEGLFSREFYQGVSRCLRSDGVMACQSESPWFKKELHNRIQTNVRSGFKYVKPYMGIIPTYPRGSWSWTLGSNEQIQPAKFDQLRLSKLEGLRYLNAELLPAVFALPTFFSEKLR